MTDSPVTIDRRDRIAIVRLDRGDRTNALSIAVMRALLDAARSFEDDHETAAVILTGNAHVFSLGLDLHDPALAEIADAPLAEQRHALALGPRMRRAWEEIEPMTIAAVEGWCVGGGLVLATACDLRVAATAATFYAPEIERGMNMGWGALPQIVNLVGPARAKRLVNVAEQVSAATALDWGLADYPADDGGAVDRALEIAGHIAGLPPAQVRMNKANINAYASALAHAVAQSDRDQFALAQRSGDYAEGMASFREKRPARFTGA